MKAFSNLLSDLILTSSRNRKLSLLEQYFSSTPDPDRGYALAALTGSLNFKNIKASFFKDLIKEKQDEHLFDLSYDYVGDLAETISLLWDQEKSGNMPRLSSLFENLKKAKIDDLRNHIINFTELLTLVLVLLQPRLSPWQQQVHCLAVSLLAKLLVLVRP